MGRRKILINQITDSKLRNITFIKRRHGLIRKAAELSLLCNVNMLLIFEDGNGNLIQFSRNKITTIPSFFKECTYSSVSEFTANDYPNFFNPSHRRNRRGRKNEGSNKEAVVIEQKDGLPVLEDRPLLVPEIQNFQKGENLAIAVPGSISEDYISPGTVSCSSSEEPSHYGRNEIPPISDTQMREHYYNQTRPSQSTDNTKLREIDANYLEEQEAYLNQVKPYQNQKDTPMKDPMIEHKPIQYIQPRIPHKHPMKRFHFIEDGPHYRNYPFEYNMPQYSDYHPNYWSSNHYHDRYPQGPLHFSYYMRLEIRTFREMSDEEMVDKMFRFPPKGLRMDSSNHKSERNEFIHRPQNFAKNGERVVTYVDPDYQEIPSHHLRGAYYGYGDNVSSNVKQGRSAPFFNSEQVNVKCYVNSFESYSFDEFSDPHKKFKQS